MALLGRQAREKGISAGAGWGVTPAGSSLTAHLPKTKARAEACSGEARAACSGRAHNQAGGGTAASPGWERPAGTAPNRRIDPVHSPIEAPQGEKAQTFCLRESHHPSKTPFPLEIAASLAQEPRHSSTPAANLKLLIDSHRRAWRKQPKGVAQSKCPPCVFSGRKQRLSEMPSDATIHGNTVWIPNSKGRCLSQSPGRVTDKAGTGKLKCIISPGQSRRRRHLKSSGTKTAGRKQLILVTLGARLGFSHQPQILTSE